MFNSVNRCCQQIDCEWRMTSSDAESHVSMAEIEAWSCGQWWFLSHFGVSELFNVFTTVFLVPWLVSFLSGQTSFRGEFSFIVFMLFMVFLPLDIFLYHTLVCGLWITLRYTGPVVFNSSGRLSKFFFKKATGHLFLPVANIIGIASRHLTHIPPLLVFAKPSAENLTNSTPLSSFWEVSYHGAPVGRAIQNSFWEATRLC